MRSSVRTCGLQISRFSIKLRPYTEHQTLIFGRNPSHKMENRDFLKGRLDLVIIRMQYNVHRRAGNGNPKYDLIYSGFVKNFVDLRLVLTALDLVDTYFCAWLTV